MSAAPIPWKHVRNVLVLFAPLWIGATVVFAAAGVAYALFKKDAWSARQPLVVRDEATGAVDRLGRFASQTEMKAAQQTILEMTQDPEVVRRALLQVGVPENADPASWPTNELVEKTISQSVNLVAPKGSEFGNTEVVYLEVKSGAKERATEFCSAMYDNLTSHLRNVRRVRADSIIEELHLARDLAKENLDEATARLRMVETEFGKDLGELRNLNDSISGEGATRRAMEVTAAELQKAQLELQKLKGIYALLSDGASDPNKMLISGSDLLTSQPSLLRLKDGLIAAQLKTSALSGHYTDQNPKRRSALAAENRIRQQLQMEIETVVLAMQPRIALQENIVERMERKMDEQAERLQRLADARSDYAKIDSEVKHRTELLGAAEKSLTDAQASRSAALSTNLVAELGPPQVTDNPIGPSGALVAAGSSVAGLLFGLGAVFLIAPGPTESHGRRRWSDYLSGQGRRATDQEQEDRRDENQVAVERRSER